MFILASKSPQRKAILERLGVAFKVVAPSFDEANIREKDPEKRALLLACGKAQEVSSTYPDHWVIGCDTLVIASNGELLEKPNKREEAARMLRFHSGNISTVHSALCIQKGEETRTGISSAKVHFRALSDAEIEWWIQTGLWRDRSGGFQVEGEGRKLYEKIEGEFETVVGFPMSLFQQLRANIDFLRKRGNIKLL